MSTQGTIEIDFGAFPGSATATVAVTGQTTILSNSFCEAWIFPSSTGSTDHSIDEHYVDYFDVMAGPPTAGVGFTIYGIAPLGTGNRVGKYRLGWVWA